MPATIGMLRQLLDAGELTPVGGTAFALTPALRESYTSGSTEELEYVALTDAARTSLRLLAVNPDPEDTDEQEPPRRVVVSADVEDVTLRPDLDHAVVRVSGPIPMDAIAAIHVDAPEAEEAVRAAAAVIDDADLGDEDAELALGDVEDHELAWYATQELPFLLELM